MKITGDGSAASVQGGFNVVEATIGEIHTAMRSGRLTSQQLVRIYLKRIEPNRDTPQNPPRKRIMLKTRRNQNVANGESGGLSKDVVKPIANR